MQIKGNNIQQARLTIRVSRNTLSFSVVDREAEHQLIYEPYTVKSGVSMAANLRQAFKESTLLQRGYQKVRVYLDSPILLVPIEEFHEEDIDVLYQHAFNSHNSDAILYRVQPELNAVAVFPINKDLKMVVEDNFKVSASHLSCNRCGTICIIAVSPAFTASSMFISTTRNWTFSVSRRTVSNSSTRSMPSMPRMPSISFSMYGSS